MWKTGVGWCSETKKDSRFGFLVFFLFFASLLSLVLVLGVDYLNPFACLLLHIVHIPPSAPSPPSCSSDI